MLTVEQALDRILADVPRLPAEDVGIDDVHGRVLAEDVHSPVDVPPWDNSAMDGYAVRAGDTAEAGDAVGGEVVLRLNEVVGAGYVATTAVGEGTATGIMTGAPMPEGADAVVMVEDTDGSREREVRVRAKVRPGQHVRRRGSDVARGDRILHAGERLTAPRVGLAASVGLASLRCVRRPVVAILSTGDEVVPPGRPLGPGQIWSSNNYAIAGLVREAGGVPKDMGTAPDRLEALVADLARCADAGADAIVTTGGVSVGAWDLVKDAFAGFGGAVDFWKVRMKPGKPLAFGHVQRKAGGSGRGGIGDSRPGPETPSSETGAAGADDAAWGLSSAGRSEVGGRRVPLFGLPGNPVSCIVNFLEFVRPWLLVAQGSPTPFLPVVEAVAGADIPERPGRNTLVRVALEAGPDGFVCRVAGPQSSHVMSGLARSHGFLLLGPESDGVRAGERCRVQLFDPSFLDGAAPGYGW